MSQVAHLGDRVGRLPDVGGRKAHRAAQLLQLVLEILLSLPEEGGLGVRSIASLRASDVRRDPATSVTGHDTTLPLPCDFVPRQHAVP